MHYTILRKHIYKGNWAINNAVVCGGLLQNPFIGLQEAIGNLALGRPIEFEVTLRMARCSHLAYRLGHGCDGREEIEALDKATGSVGEHRSQLRRGHEI